MKKAKDIITAAINTRKFWESFIYRCNNSRNIISAAISYSCLIVMCISLVSCGNADKNEKHSETRLLLNTYCTITIYASSNSAQLLDEAFELCERLEKLLSMTIEGSDIWNINYAQGQSVEVEKETAEIIKFGIEYGVLSEGKFDITIGKLSRLWDFGSGGNTIPDLNLLEKARQSVDYRQISVEESSSSPSRATVKIVSNDKQADNDNAWIDLGGIAKGYIADEIAGLLKANGVDNALIDLGGDIYALGHRQNGTPWRLGVRKPFGRADEFLCIIEVTDAAVVSSGIYERQFEEEGVLYHHILDPGTGMPAQSDVIGATIIAESAVTGEGLSTIAILTGSGQIRELCIHTPGFIGAILVLDNYEVIEIGEVKRER